MTLFKLKKYVDFLSVSDSIAQSDGEIGVAIDSVLNPNWDEVEVLDILYACNSFVVSCFELK